MSAPVRSDDEKPSMFPTMYAPPWAREQAQDLAGDAGMAAVDRALNASDEFRQTLPPAAPLEAKRRWNKPFDGDIAAKHLRERPSLDPVAVPAPPVQERGAPLAVFARVTGAVGLAALAAFFVVGVMPRPLQGAASHDPAIAKPFWARLFGMPKREEPQVLDARTIVPQPVATQRVIIPATEPVAFADRMAAVPVKAETEPTATARTIQEQPAPPPAPPAPRLRSLDSAELNMLLKRGEELIREGDIAAARLMLARAAEAGDARAALTLGATYDADVLRKLGVLGLAGDVAQARAWYSKAAEFGSGEATRRLEQIAQSAR